ncbi:MAG: DUF3180 domain-containing protein [Rhodoglobus sp.]
MTRSTPGPLIVLGVIGTVVGILAQVGLAAMNLAKLRPEYSFALTLLLVGAGVVALAVPIRRSTRGNPVHRVDPFYATRVVALAKALAVGGALIAGVGLGFVLELALRSGGPGAEAYLRVFSVLAGGIAVLVGGLVAEYLCTVPPSDDEDSDGGPPTAAAG